MTTNGDRGTRLTAADRPGVAQPVPERPVPDRPWRGIFIGAVVVFVAAMAVWEWQMRRLQLAAGDLRDNGSAWAEQRRRIDAGEGAVVIVGDSRILFDTDLDRFAAMTGVRPIQLALPGTNARPFLEELSRDDDFRGLLIVGISDVSYFRDALGLRGDALERYRFEAPSARTSFLIDRVLQGTFAFMDDNYTLPKLVQRSDEGVRAGVRGPYQDVWKISKIYADRQYAMWPRLETDAYLRDHAISVWMSTPRMPVSDATRTMTLAVTRDSVARIRARGGEVVFVRPPSHAPLRALEETQIPRKRGWDALLADAGVAGAHYEDYPSMQGLELPEWSHLSRTCATVFTDAYVRALAQLTSRLKLREDAPTAPSPNDCRSALPR